MSLKDEPVLSRHRLPRTYRIGLTILWLMPIAIFVLVLVIRWGFRFDPRLILPLLLMALPALYVWQEGVDVLPSGIIRRAHVPRYYPYDCLETWYYDRRPDRHTLTVWDARSQKVLEYRTAHLTDLPRLLAALKSNVRYRNWPS